jgi:hypothetical protein
LAISDDLLAFRGSLLGYSGLSHFWENSLYECQQHHRSGKSQQIFILCQFHLAAKVHIFSEKNEFLSYHFTVVSSAAIGTSLCCIEISLVY